MLLLFNGFPSILVVRLCDVSIFCSFFSNIKQQVLRLPPSNEAKENKQQLNRGEDCQKDHQIRQPTRGLPGTELRVSALAV